MKTKLFDVVIYNIETRLVESVVGKGMELEDGHYNARRRLLTVLPRLNDHYSAAIVQSGKYEKGAKLPKNTKFY